MAETDISVEEITKKPKKALEKILKNLVVGGGAAAQEVASASIQTAMPSLNKTASSLGQMIISSIAAGTVKNSWIKNFARGVSAGAAKDIIIGIRNALTAKAAPTGAAPTGIMAKIMGMFKPATPALPNAASIPSAPIVDAEDMEVGDFE